MVDNDTNKPSRNIRIEGEVMLTKNTCKRYLKFEENHLKKQGKTTKIRIFPIIPSDEEVKDWLVHPEVTKELLKGTLLKIHPTWNVLQFRLDPNIEGLSYGGRPLLPILPILENIVLAVVEVPFKEPEELFVVSSETGLPLIGDAEQRG